MLVFLELQIIFDCCSQTLTPTIVWSSSLSTTGYMASMLITLAVLASTPMYLPTQCTSTVMWFMTWLTRYATYQIFATSFRRACGDYTGSLIVEQVLYWNVQPGGKVPLRRDAAPFIVTNNLFVKNQMNKGKHSPVHLSVEIRG